MTILAPKNKEFWIKEYVNNKKSTYDICKEFDFNICTVKKRLHEFGLMRNYSNMQKQELNHKWKGDEVRVDSRHYWIRHNKPKPELCDRCKLAPPKELSNNSGEHRRDINDYEWLCLSCHRRKDKNEKIHKISYRELMDKKN